ncbi:MAG: peptidoglycan-binding protein [Burkholderiales bacterium]|nr:peptidoglycan-binding protein [Burkholderiales bacterium]
MNTLDIQKRLLELGYDLGAGLVDGIFGAMTRTAIAKFQEDKGLDIQWPGTVGPKTEAALFDVLPIMDQPLPLSKAPFRPWFDLALTKKGLHEERDYIQLSTWMKSDGRYLGDPRKYPWCGELVSSCFALTIPSEPQPTNPYLARSWLKFGVSCEPTIGAVAVFWRVSRIGIYGHVAFHAGEDDNAFHVLGGNQSNKVSITRILKSRLLGSRWPSKVPLGQTKLATLDADGGLSLNEA